MLVSKHLIILSRWGEHLRNMEAFKRTCFELLSHPDVTYEQLSYLHDKARAINQMHYEMRNAMRAKGYNV